MGYDHFMHNHKYEVNLHTLDTDYWKKIQNCPYSCVSRSSGVFTSGVVNWLTYDVSSSSMHAIVSLDLDMESYQNILPDIFGDRFQDLMGIEALLVHLCKW